jgi:hypothetical protein
MNVAVGIALALALAAPAGAQMFPNRCTPDRDCTNAPMLSTIADESTPTPPVDELLEEHPGGPLNDWSNPLLNRKWTPRPNEARIQYEETSLHAESIKPEFAKPFMAKMQALGYKQIQWGPMHVEKSGTFTDKLSPSDRQYIGQTVFAVGVDTKVTPQMQAKFKRELGDSLSRQLGYPVILYQEVFPDSR